MFHSNKSFYFKLFSFTLLVAASAQPGNAVRTFSPSEPSEPQFSQNVFHAAQLRPIRLNEVSDEVVVPVTMDQDFSAEEDNDPVMSESTALPMDTRAENNKENEELLEISMLHMDPQNTLEDHFNIMSSNFLKGKPTINQKRKILSQAKRKKGQVHQIRKMFSLMLAYKRRNETWENLKLMANG